MSANESADPGRIVEHQEGELLRVQTSGIYAADLAPGLLGFLEAELDAEIEANGATEPVAVRLEGLDVELSTEGREVQLRRVGGSRDEFEELCELIVSEYLRA